MLNLYLANQTETQKWWLPWASVSWSETLNIGASGQVSIPYHVLMETARANMQTVKQLLFDNARKILIEDTKEEKIIFKGVLTDASLAGEDMGAINLTLSFADPSCLLAKRLTGGNQSYTDANIMTVAEALLTTAQAAGNLGVTMGTVDASEAMVTRNYKNARILDSLVGLSKNKIANGLEWYIDTDWKLNLAYPYRGENKPEIIFDEQNILSFQNQLNLLGNLVNQVRIKGSGNLAVTTFADQNAQIAWGVQEAYLSATDLSEADGLAERAAQYLAGKATPLAGEQIAIEVATQNPNWREVNVGDWVKLKLTALDLDQMIRVQKKTLSNTDGTMQMSLVLAPQNLEASFGQNYRELLRRLERIETS